MFTTKDYLLKKLCAHNILKRLINIFLSKIEDSVCEFNNKVEGVVK
jgi:hypothetical protein